MSAIFGLLYLALILVYLFGSIIIIYHIAKFSYQKGIMTLTITVFLVVLAVLILANVASFTAINWESIFSFAKN